MPSTEETEPVVLLGGPFDGMELDVLPTETRIWRTTSLGRVAEYFRHGCSRFYFVGYVDKSDTMM